MDLEDIEDWNVLRIEHDAGTAEPAVASAGVIDSGIYEEITVAIDPDDSHTGGEPARIRKYPDDDDLYLVFRDFDEEEEHTIENINVIAEDARDPDSPIRSDD